MQLSPPTCVDTLAPGDGSVIGDGNSVPDDATIGVDAPPPGACIADSDCNAGICHELTGTCIPDAEALFVSPTGQGTSCTRASPCGTLQAAIDARTQTRYSIALAEGAYSTSFDTMASPNGVNKLLVSGPTRDWEGVVITSSAMNRVHPMLDAIFEGITIRGGGSASGDGINSRGTTTLSRVHIDLASVNGVTCGGGSTKIYDSEISKATSYGVYANGGTVTVERSRLLSNGTYGVFVDGAAYSIVNSIIASNGKTLMPTGGVRLRPAGNAALAVFRFNTIARNQGLTYPSMLCDTQAAFSNTIVGEQSVVLTTISANCSATYSLFNAPAGAAPAGTGNITGDPLFVSMTDFHLQMGSPAIDKANPTGAEPIDIDGQQRVAPPDIGADERP